MKDSRHTMLAKLPHVFFATSSLVSTIGLVFSLFNHECTLEAAQAVSGMAGTIVFKADPSTWLPALSKVFTQTGPYVWFCTLGISIGLWSLYHTWLGLDNHDPSQRFLPDMKNSSRSGIIWGSIVCIGGALAYTFAPDVAPGSDSDCSWTIGIVMQGVGALFGVGGLVWTIVSACRLAAYAILFDKDNRPKTISTSLYRIIGYSAIALTFIVIMSTIYTVDLTSDWLSIFALGALAVFAVTMIIKPNLLGRRP
ncbi:hypothetical protein HZC00_04540 [Candidatus Kaiserbacteria bacterium]|nr:hypothetical protein [Candidatus Kaiserbacteria bacterium]